MTKHLSLIVLLFVFSLNALAFCPPDSSLISKNEKIKSGWNFGGIPIVAYNSDMGIQLGAQGNLFDYGDGSHYPDFRRSIKLEGSYYTKGTGAFQLIYDDKVSISNNIRLIADISYIMDKALDFYGFNGAMSVFNPHFSSKDNNDPLYISRMFYRHERKLFRITSDLIGNVEGTPFNWIAGIGVYHFTINPVNVSKLNKNKNEADMLPYVESLYDTYNKWSIISDNEKDGGLVTSIRFGASIDTRNIEANPTKGVWTEVMFNIAPSIFPASNDMAYGIFAITHRQYISLVKNHLTFDYRVSYEGQLFGKTPFFMQPILLCSYNKATIFDGVGGAKSVRGILRDRIIGSHFVYGNLELRYRFFDFRAINQNFYLTLSPFCDFGSVIIQSNKDEIDYAKNQLLLPIEQRSENFKYYYVYDNEGNIEKSVPYEYDNYFTHRDSDKLHVSYGIGLQLSMNQNFVISLSYARPVDPNDGIQGFYFNTGFIF